MIIRLLIGFYILCVTTIHAQKLPEYPVKAGEVPNEVLPNEAKYLLPAFKIGTGSFRNGTSTFMLFNYNFLLDEMHFIGEHGDTLAIANPETINSITIDSMVFYYDKGYVRQIFNQGTYKLAVKQQMVQTADKTRGGYDMPLGNASIKTYGSINGINGQMYNLQVKKDVLFIVVNSFYVAGTYNHFLIANQKNLVNIFEENKIKNYLKEHKVNFNKEEDLRALLISCAE